jgi:hypothetical protein
MTALHKLRRRCQGLLRRKLPDGVIHLSANEGGLIAGHVVADRFRDLSDGQRQQWLDRALFRKLLPAERHSIGTITIWGSDELASDFPCPDDGWWDEQPAESSDPGPF